MRLGVRAAGAQAGWETDRSQESQSHEGQGASQEGVRRRSESRHV